eukprot:6239140-Alexandrium_andersonii.AAC.1
MCGHTACDARTHHPPIPHFGWRALTNSGDDRSPTSCPHPLRIGMGGSRREPPSPTGSPRCLPQEGVEGVVRPPPRRAAR